MKLKKGIDIEQFMERVKQCDGDIHFCTEEGDILNVKSTLAQYIFMVVIRQEQLMLNGHLEFSNDADAEILRDFIE